MTLFHKAEGFTIKERYSVDFKLLYFILKSGKLSMSVREKSLGKKNCLNNIFPKTKDYFCSYFNQACSNNTNIKSTYYFLQLFS